MNVRVEGTGPDAIWYLRCNDCASAGQATAWWPIGSVHWIPTSGLQRCRACHQAKRRRADHASAEFVRARERRYYANHRERRLLYARNYYSLHADEINEVKRAKHREKTNADRAA